MKLIIPFLFSDMNDQVNFNINIKLVSGNYVKMQELTLTSAKAQNVRNNHRTDHIQYKMCVSCK